MSQKDAFLSGEGDAWFERNAGSAERQIPASDPLLRVLQDLIPESGGQRLRVLEVGCGDGARLHWLAANRNCECSGVDPSPRAVEAMRSRGLDAVCGTADRLEFGDASFDIVAFGFCLYLCDREDLFRIAAEADRVLRAPGWLVIYDFHASHPTRRDYHHLEGLYSYKMDYSALFTWHPDYSMYGQKVFHHGSGAYTDDASEWVATTVLRKRRQ